MFIFVCLVTGIVGVTCAQPPVQPARGELLYKTHCDICHTETIHWRGKGLVTDWKSLTIQVNRWQESIHLQWGAEDITAVSFYLNSAFYHFPNAEIKVLALKKETL